MPQVIARLVFAVAGEFDREAAANGAMLAGEDTFDRLPGGDTQVAKPLDHLLLDCLEEAQTALGGLGRFVQMLDQAVDDDVAAQPSGLGREVADDAVAEHRFGQGGDVFGRDVIAPAPSFVVQHENTQIAIEQDIADEIFVFYPEEKQEPVAPKRRQWRFSRSSA